MGLVRWDFYKDQRKELLPLASPLHLRTIPLPVLQLRRGILQRKFSLTSLRNWMIVSRWAVAGLKLILAWASQIKTVDKLLADKDRLVTRARLEIKLSLEFKQVKTIQGAIMDNKAYRAAWVRVRLRDLLANSQNRLTIQARCSRN